MKKRDIGRAVGAADYLQWIGELKRRYRATQIKAAVAVNSALIEFYWNLGKDISEKYPGKKRNIEFFAKLSRDLSLEIGEAKGLSERNVRYSLAFYSLYAYLPQVVANKNVQQIVEQLVCLPWGHHRTIIDKCKGNCDKALFYVRRTIQNGWSRSLRNAMPMPRRSSPHQRLHMTTGQFPVRRSAARR